MASTPLAPPLIPGDATVRNPFEEPAISPPLDLARPGGRGPMMAMVGGSGGPPNLDGGGFSPDGGAPYMDGQADAGPGPGADVPVGADT